MDEWLDRLEEETSVWSIARDYARGRIVAHEAATRMREEVSGGTDALAGALGEDWADWLAELRTGGLR